MNLLQSLLSTTLTRLTGNAAAPSVNITFTPALPPQVRQQIASQSLDHPFTLTVSNSNGNQLTLTTPTGQTFTATVNPPLPVGTQLQLTAQINPESLPTPQPTIQARILPPETTTANNAAPVKSSTSPNSQLLTPNSSPQPLLTLTPGSQITHRELATVFTNTLLQQTATTPQTPHSQAPLPSLPVPAGPVAITLPTNINKNILNTLLGQPLTLTPTGPLQPNATQLATLTPSTPQIPTTSNPQNPTPPIRITLNLGVALPLAKPQEATLTLPLPPSRPNPQSPTPNPLTSQPILFLIGQQATPSIPLPPTPNTQILLSTQPETTPQPHLTPNSSFLTPVAARILPPLPNQQPGTQSALLATGTIITLKSPQPLPTGSIIVADFPITPTSTVQRVLTPDANSQSHPNITAQSQTAAPVAAQTPQAVLAPGMVMQGTITGQNEQGQPLLTITQPGTLAGATVPLTLTDTTTLLPIGAQLSIRVESSLTATILGLTLPPQTQTAYTVSTLGSRWENLQQGLTILQQQAPVQAANLRASLPQLANLLPGLIAFTNALRTKNLEDAFDSEATRLLKAMGIDLSADISQLSQLQQRPAHHADTQWRGTLFPYVEAPNEDPRQGGFFWRREKSDNPRAPTNTRFVVELEMSRMGPMQLDGLITYPEVWLKLRRTSVPEPGFIEGLQSLVNGLLQSSGLQGGIGVETTATFPVNPRTELMGQTENPLPTTA